MKQMWISLVSLFFSLCLISAQTAPPLLGAAVPAAIELQPAATDEELFSCDFEQNLCGMLIEVSPIKQFSWVRHQGSTPSDDTGPAFDHTTLSSTGYYMYTEASDREPNEVTRLTISRGSLLTNTSVTLSDACLTFWYHMYGQHIGTLNVTVGQDDVIWSLSFNQTNEWIQKNVTLKNFLTSDSASSGRGVSFVGVRGGEEEGQPFGDIAVDDVILYAGRCGQEEPTTTTTTSTTTTTATTTMTTTTTTTTPTTTSTTPTTTTTTPTTTSTTPTTTSTTPTTTTTTQSTTTTAVTTTPTTTTTTVQTTTTTPIETTTTTMTTSPTTTTAMAETTTVPSTTVERTITTTAAKTEPDMTTVVQSTIGDQASTEAMVVTTEVLETTEQPMTTAGVETSDQPTTESTTDNEMTTSGLTTADKQSSATSSTTAATMTSSSASVTMTSLAVEMTSDGSGTSQGVNDLQSTGSTPTPQEQSGASTGENRLWGLSERDMIILVAFLCAAILLLLILVTVLICCLCATRRKYNVERSAHLYPSSSTIDGVSAVESQPSGNSRGHYGKHGYVSPYD